MDLILAFFLSLLGTKLYISFARKIGIGQLIKEDGPDLHGYKRGTPTMGGVVFTAVSVLFMIIEGIDWKIWLSMILFSLLGVADDLSSVIKKDAYGMRAGTKFILQTIAASIVVGFIDKSLVSFGSYGMDLGWFYKIFAVLLIVGASNAVNITDGLDGLASLVTLSATIPMFAVTMKSAPDRSLLLVSAALLGFLFHNIKPAKVFMGDAGSLALGAYLAISAIKNGLEIPLALFGLIFVIETLSVILQVASYKIRRKRVFLMAPIHHHFEMRGWSEERIVFFFTAINLTSSLIALGWLI